MVIHGGALRVGGILGLRRFLRHWPLLATKTVVLWHTGANPGHPDVVTEVWRSHLTDEQLQSTTRFYLRGGFDAHRLGWLDRILMRGMVAHLRRKKILSEDERGLLAMYDHPHTELDRVTIAPLVNHVKAPRG